jgi:hypothetical protein
MKGHPIELLTPVFRWLDWLIAEHGHHIYILMVWISPFLIAWVLRGGLRRKRPTRHPVGLTVIWIPPPSAASRSVPPPLPPRRDASADSQPSSNNDAQSFSA